MAGDAAGASQFGGSSHARAPGAEGPFVNRECATSDAIWTRHREVFPGKRKRPRYAGACRNEGKSSRTLESLPITTHIATFGSWMHVATNPIVCGSTHSAQEKGSEVAWAVAGPHDIAAPTLFSGSRRDTETARPRSYRWCLSCRAVDHCPSSLS